MSRFTRRVGTLRRDFMSNTELIARNLAAAFLSGTWSLRALLSRASQACGEPGRGLRPFIRRLLTDFPQNPGDRALELLTRRIYGHRAFQFREEQKLFRVFHVAPTMHPANDTAASWQAPALTTSTALADWLGLKPGELDWFADCHGHEWDVKRPGPLRHYSYRWLPKASGKWRLLEMPKTRLKTIQRRILHEILDRIPPHDAAHGFRRNRSIATYAALHCSQRIVMRFDLRHFFPSVRSSRIHAVFANAGYPAVVARLLTGLCTNAVPDDVWRLHPGDDYYSRPTWQEQRRFRYPHLPQGAPTSPALANICAYRLDCRLLGLANSMGGQYTRYADDLAFSGDRDLERSIRRFQVMVCRIALEEGFETHLRKTRFMRQSVRQQLVGVVVNQHLNMRRDEFDRIKAILHNCARHGLASQNREGHESFRSHLLGLVAHATMLNAARGERLRDMFDRINWDEPAAS